MQEPDDDGAVRQRREQRLAGTPDGRDDAGIARELPDVGDERRAGLFVQVVRKRGSGSGAALNADGDAALR